MKNRKKLSLKNVENSVKIFGVKVDSTSFDEALKKVLQRIKRRQKTFIFTPNPEFLVFAKRNLWFKRILNLADISLPDGVGLVWGSRILGKPLKERIAGVDFAKRLLEIANKNGWRVGMVGLRRGVPEEERRQIEILRKRYPGAFFLNLGEVDSHGRGKLGLKIVFACQGMGEQEKWIVKNSPNVEALVFFGAGGALDFLTGFAPRAPFIIRKIGFEWLFRLLIQPWRWRRQKALLDFIYLLLKEKFKAGD